MSARPDAAANRVTNRVISFLPVCVLASLARYPLEGPGRGKRFASSSPALRVLEGAGEKNAMSALAVGEVEDVAVRTSFGERRLHRGPSVRRLSHWSSSRPVGPARSCEKPGPPITAALTD